MLQSHRTLTPVISASPKHHFSNICFKLSTFTTFTCIETRWHVKWVWVGWCVLLIMTFVKLELSDKRCLTLISAQDCDSLQSERKGVILHHTLWHRWWEIRFKLIGVELDYRCISNCKHCKQCTQWPTVWVYGNTRLTELHGKIRTRNWFSHPLL